jgi:hypothetical protein
LMDDKCHAIYFINLLKQGYAANPLLTSQVQVNKWVRSNYVTPITSAKEKPPSILAALATVRRRLWRSQRQQRNPEAKKTPIAPIYPALKTSGLPRTDKRRQNNESDRY